MTIWNSSWPNGTVAVKNNKLSGQQNTTHIETIMELDHFWNTGANENGRHRFVQMPDNSGDPAIAAGMDLAFFTKDDSGGDKQPFVINSAQTMQMLGIRSMGVFDIAAGVITLVYSHNVASVAKEAAADGTFVVTYTNVLPSINYLTYVGSIRNSGSGNANLKTFVKAETSVVNVKKTTDFTFYTATQAGILTDPLQAWFVCFGG